MQDTGNHKKLYKALYIAAYLHCNEISIAEYRLSAHDSACG